MGFVNTFEGKYDTRTTLSTLWIVVMFNMVFADIFSIFIELNKFQQVKLPGDAQTLMLVAAFLTNVPIAMIFLSKILKYKLNRILNIVVSAFTIFYVWGGMSSYPHYIVNASIETIIAIGIIVIAWKWREEKNYERT